MALVNVAMSLAQSGRKVLMVDFDLEAPGLETFDLLRPPASAQGVVDFVTAYLATNATPDVRDYVFERSERAAQGGKIWIMPAGRRDDGYSDRLNAIDWARLYSEHDGYLMFEDLKAQWHAAFAPDYVFIDSRTGHTDVGGICTRQLPDAVVSLFFPNDQNLLGLTKVVADIREESRSGRRTPPVDLHFVTSNVPDLDDEDHILADRMDAFRAALGYERLSATIHHYSSLALLNQVIFTVERPRSRLAAEYNALRDQIVQRNPHDLDGVLGYLRSLQVELDREDDESLLGLDNMESRLRQISVAQASNPTVLFELGLVDEKRGQTAEAIERYNEAERLGLTSSELLRRRAILADLFGGEGSPDQVTTDAKAILELGDAQTSDVFFAVSRLISVEKSALAGLTSTPAFAALDLSARLRLADALLTQKGREVVERIVVEVLREDPELSRLRTGDHSEFCLALIGTGHFREAMELLGPERPLSSDETFLMFNFAMAEWGLMRSPPRDLFARMTSLERESKSGQNPNFKQCMAVAEWAAGDAEAAQARLAEARELLPEMGKVKRRGRIFSCWRYLYVSIPEFQKDLDLMARMVAGEDLEPAFLKGGEMASVGGPQGQPADSDDV